MGSCVSKKAAREGKVAAPLPPVKEINALSPVAEEEEEVKEVVLSETPAPRLPRPPPESVKKRQEPSEEEEAGSGSGSESASVGLVAKEKAMAMAKLGGEQEVVKKAVDMPEKLRARRTASPEESKPKPKPKPKQGVAGNGRARSPSPSSAHHRQPGGQQPVPPPPRPPREPAVVSAFGCRSGRFSPSAARRAAESAVRRSHSAREADMALPAKRALSTSINAGHGNASNTLSRRDPGERSARRSDSPTARKRPSPSPSPVHRQASATRRAARENLSGTPERSSRPRVRDVVGADDAGCGGEEQPAFTEGGVEHKKAAAGALGQNPSVAMECFIFL